MESYSSMAAEFGFLIKMTGVTIAVIVAGFLIRKRHSSPKREAK